MKPLELTVYPKTTHSASLTLYAVGRDTHYTLAGADKRARDKRFTEAELAAEYWAAREASNWSELMMNEWAADRYSNRASKMCDNWFRKKRKSDYEGHLLHRFATLPHYDEASL